MVFASRKFGRTKPASYLKRGRWSTNSALSGLRWDCVFVGSLLMIVFYSNISKNVLFLGNQVAHIFNSRCFFLELFFEQDPRAISEHARSKQRSPSQTLSIFSFFIFS